MSPIPRRIVYFSRLQLHTWQERERKDSKYMLPMGKIQAHFNRNVEPNISVAAHTVT